jgi:hypothetical protein
MYLSASFRKKERIYPALRCKECIDPAPFADMLEFREQRWLYDQRLAARHIPRGFDAASTEYVRPVNLVSVAYFNRLSQIAPA